MNSAFLQLLDGASLYSDRTTRDGTYMGKREYNTNFNKIISPNKKAIAILLQNGNFQILTGEFNAAGEPKKPDNTFENNPFNASLYCQVVFDLFKKSISYTNTGFVGGESQFFALVDFLPTITGQNKVIKNSTGVDKAPFQLLFSSIDGLLIKNYVTGLVYKWEVNNLTLHNVILIQFTNYI